MHRGDDVEILAKTTGNRHTLSSAEFFQTNPNSLKNLSLHSAHLA
jgi:hypothetical protein